MSRKPSFANLRGATPTPVSAPASGASGLASGAGSQRATEGTGTPSTRAQSREGRKQIAGFFTPDMSFAMHMLARRQGRSLQSLMTEAFNDVLRKHGESPMGE